MMERGTRDEVEYALQWFAQSAGGPGGVLAAEVRALRDDYADLESRSLAALDQMTVDATTLITGAGINADLAEQYAALRATIARVEALPEQFENQACGALTNANTWTIAASKLRAALRGER